MAPSENEPLVRKTLLTVAAMVGACAIFVGLLSVLAVAIVGRAVNPASTADGPVLVPAEKVEKAEQSGKPGQAPKVQLPKANPI